MDRIYLENFRCFHERQEARLAPLTLLVGENSTGKTSFLALIRALWAVAYHNQSPDFKEDPYDLGSFDEIVHFHGESVGRTNQFEAGFTFTDEKREGAGESPKRFSVTFESETNAPIPVKVRLKDEKRNIWMESERQNDKSLQCRIGTPNGNWRWDVPTKSPLYDILQFNLVVLPIVFRDLRDASGAPSRASNVLHYLSDESESLHQPYDGIGEENWGMIENLHRDFLLHCRHPNSQVYAGAPVRSKPRRTYERSQLKWDSEGDYIPMYLANVHSQKEGEWNSLRKDLAIFGQDAGLFNEISVRPLGSRPSDPFQLQIRKGGRESKGLLRNLIDVGYGVSQALPVVTELLRGEAPLFLLQQPEVHLHPSAQAALGSLFCQIASPKRQLVVETHSDHLLDRVRMDVRDGEGKLKPEDVSILFFEQGDLDVRIHSLGLDGDGNVLGAPAGYRDFFKAELRRSVGL